LASDIGRRFARGSASFDDLLNRARASIAADELITLGENMLRHRPAHDPKSNEPNGFIHHDLSCDAAYNFSVNVDLKVRTTLAGVVRAFRLA